MIDASTMPMSTAAMAIRRGSRSPASATMPARDGCEVGQRCSAGRRRRRSRTRTAEIAAEMKKPRLMAGMPLLSVGRSRVMKTPMTAVTTPMAGTISGKTRPSSPKAALPRISAATSVTA